MSFLIAQGSRSLVSKVAEVNWGVTPVTPSMVAVPYTTFNVNLTKDVHEDLSIRADRRERFSLHGNRTIAGDLD